MSPDPTLRVRLLQDDRHIVEALRVDPAWTAYALSDLEPPFREYSRFFGAGHGRSVDAIVLHFKTPRFISLLPYGTSEGVEAILKHLEPLPELFFVAFGEEHHELLDDFLLLNVWGMYRMAATPSSLQLEEHVAVRRLGPSDLSAIEELYGHWQTSFFQPMLLETGIFCGYYDGDRLVSVAGTHTRSRRFQLGTIGGVFTHPGYRGRGLAKAVTATVARALVEEGAQLVVLNVKQDNAPAIAAYRRLGFTIHRPYLEGEASPS